MLKHIIFDVDGTLLDTEMAVLKSLQKTMKDLFSIEHEEVYYHFALGIPGKSALEKLKIEPDQQQEILDIWESNFKDNLSTITIFPQIEACVKDIQSLHLKVGIITSKTENEFNHDAHYFSFLKQFNPIITASDTSSHKPNSEPMLAYLQNANILPSEAIYIGDTLYDYQCATSANVPFGLAKWGAKSQEGMKNILVFNEPVDLWMWIKEQLNA